MNKDENGNQKIAEHVFSGSITMTGVCITVIALFKAMKTSFITYADEVIALDTCIFIVSGILSYVSLRKSVYDTAEHIANILFFTGMMVMLIAGIILVYFTY